MLEAALDVELVARKWMWIPLISALKRVCLIWSGILGNNTYVCPLEEDHHAGPGQRDQTQGTQVELPGIELRTWLLGLST